MGGIALKALILSADNFEDQELFYPLNRLKEEDVIVKVASMKKGIITGEYGYSLDVDMTFDEVNPEEFDILILPGGKAPEKVRLEEKALEIARYFFRENKPVGAICIGHRLRPPFSPKSLSIDTVSYTHLRAHETKANLVCRLLLEKKKKKQHKAKKKNNIKKERKKNKKTKYHK